MRQHNHLNYRSEDAARRMWCQHAAPGSRGVHEHAAGDHSDAGTLYEQVGIAGHCAAWVWHAGVGGVSDCRQGRCGIVSND